MNVIFLFRSGSTLNRWQRYRKIKIATLDNVQWTFSFRCLSFRIPYFWVFVAKTIYFRPKWTNREWKTATKKLRKREMKYFSWTQSTESKPLRKHKEVASSFIQVLWILIGVFIHIIVNHGPHSKSWWNCHWIIAIVRSLGKKTDNENWKLTPHQS